MMTFTNRPGMEKLHSQNKRPGITNLQFQAVSFILTIIFVTLFVTGRPAAQQFGGLVTFNDKIVFDEEEVRLLYPYFVMVAPPENEIYVIDSDGRITIYTSDLFPVYTVKKTAEIRSPRGLAVDAEGNIYMAQAATKDNLRPRISVFKQCLKWVRDIYPEGFEGAAGFAPQRLAVDKKGFIYAAAAFFPGVVVLDGDGRLVEVMVPEERGEKAVLNDVTIDEEGRIYLLSERSGRIFVYDENRKFLFKFGEKGGSSGKLSRPMSVAVDNKNGRKYVVDYMRHSITVYDKDGNFIFEFGGIGWGDGWFQYPIDIAVDSEGRIFVADLFNHRVQVFDSR
jgi:DNA-binding beta-propeller fold protein YncE